MVVNWNNMSQRAAPINKHVWCYQTETTLEHHHCGQVNWGGSFDYTYLNRSWIFYLLFKFIEWLWSKRRLTKKTFWKSYSVMLKKYILANQGPGPIVHCYCTWPSISIKLGGVMLNYSNWLQWNSINTQPVIWRQIHDWWNPNIMTH